jgi:hypothetical protein
MMGSWGFMDRRTCVFQSTVHGGAVCCGTVTKYYGEPEPALALSLGPPLFVRVLWRKSITWIIISTGQIRSRAVARAIKIR